MADKTIRARLQILRQSHDYWVSANAIILKNGELGYDLDFHILKVGDGQTKWSDLPDYQLQLNTDGTSILDGGATTFDNVTNPVTIILANEQSSRYSSTYIPKKGEPVTYLDSNIQGIKIGDGRRSFKDLKYVTPYDDAVLEDYSEVEEFKV